MLMQTDASGERCTMDPGDKPRDDSRSYNAI